MVPDWFNASAVCLLPVHAAELAVTHIEKGRLWKCPMPSSATPWK
jgi:hypothetical protein